MKNLNDNQSYTIIENGEELKVNQEQKEILLDNDLIYLCDDNCSCDFYHISPEFTMKDIIEEFGISYNNFPKEKLGADCIDTWIDDENADKALIAFFIHASYHDYAAIEVVNSPKFPASGYMVKELYDIDGAKVVFMAGQPDCMWYMKKDHDRLLKCAKYLKSKVSGLEDTKKSLGAFEGGVADRIMGILSQSVIKTLGITTEKIIDDLSSTTNEHKEIVPKMELLPTTIDECWENGDTVDETVKKLISSYTISLNGHCSVL